MPDTDGDITWPFLTELFLGRPVDGIDEKDDDPVRLGDWGCAAEGKCVSVAMAARYWITFLVLSVLPAPDSPL